jgi:hypothetical protein
MQASLVADMRPAVALLEKTPVLYETMLGDLPNELLQWKPGPDRWSISEVLAHLSDIEDVYAERARRILAEDSPALQKYEPPGPEDARAYSRGVATEHLTRYATTRTAKHSELGLITLSQMLNEWASHDLGHVRQIAEIYRAHAFHPHCGPFQKYSNPKP